MNTKEIKNKKKKLKLSKTQKEVLVGLILGDGHLETQDKGKTYRLKVEHSLNQKDYLEWLFAQFKDWVNTDKPYVKVRKDGRKSIGFTTYSHGVFRFYAHQFYNQNGVKHIPKKHMFKRVLTPLALSIWFMDDGSRKSLKHKTYNIYTLAYSKRDLRIVQEVLLEKFAVETSLHKQGKAWRIYIPSKSAEKFTKLIEKFVLKFSSMKHKLVTQMPKK